MTRVLVLLAACNGERWIEEQVESILAQRGVEVNLLIGDDVSRDASRDLLAARWGADPRIQVLAWPTPSGSAGANFLRLMRHADACGFDAVALADQDDVWLPGKLAAGMAKLGESDDVCACSAAVEAFWDDGRTSVLAQDPRTRRADFLFEGAGQGCTFVLSLSFFARVQFFLASPQGATVDMHFHDWMLYVLCRAWGGRWVFDPRPQMRYRQHGGNDIGARSGLGAFSRRLGKIRDGWYAAQVAKACRVYAAAGGDDPGVLVLARQLAEGPARGSLAALGLAGRLWRAGRRRTVDRVVLVYAALAGWL